MPTPHAIILNTELPEPLIDRIRQAAPEARVWTQDELARTPEAWRDADVLLTHSVAAERLADAAQLRWIQTLGAGVDWLLSPQITARRALTITNASGIHSAQIAEHSFMLMLAITRRLPRVLAQQHASEWNAAPFTRSIPTLAGQTLGVLGVGAIGQYVAQLAAAFGMRVLGLRRGGEPAPHVDRMYAPAQLPELLTQSKYLLNALPLTAQTRGLIGARELAQLPRGAVIINIGRGPTFDTDAVVRALESGHLGGAGLDVTAPEPLPREHPLWRLDNVIITPHYSGGRPGYLEAVTDIFLDNLTRYRRGETLVNVVDVAAGY